MGSRGARPDNPGTKPGRDQRGRDNMKKAAPIGNHGVTGLPGSGDITCERMLASLSNGVIATDRDGRIVFMNPQAGEILKLNVNRVMGAYIPDVLPMTGPLVIKCLETGKPHLGHHILGKSVSLVVNITTIRKGGQPLGAVCCLQGMDEFEHSARKLASYQRQNMELQAIFRSSSDGIWLCDGAGTVLNINPTSETFNGIRAQDIIGRNVAALVAEGLFDRSATLEVLETKRQVSISQYVKRTEKYLLVTGTPVFDDEGNLSLVVSNERDMTQLNTVREQLEEHRQVTEKFKDELTALSMQELKEEGIVAVSEAMRETLRVASRLARLEASNILILGESGSGKGLLAKFIHKNSRRGRMPFIQINCAALPETLLEAELFGYEKGAFTGAATQGKAGLIEIAQGGTLFLDEIGDLPLSLQAKLLKYLDDSEVLRLGSVKPRQIDCKIVAATNRDLEALMRAKKFRQDLFYRLNTFTLRIPPLRERAEDIFELVHFFLRKYNRAYRQKKRISPETMDLLLSCPFPGNVRELKNILEHAVVMSEQETLDALPVKRGGETLTLRRVGTARDPVSPKLNDHLVATEREVFRRALLVCKSTRKMAAHLGVSQPTIVRKLKKLGLTLPAIQK